MNSGFRRRSARVIAFPPPCYIRHPASMLENQNRSVRSSCWPACPQRSAPCSAAATYRARLGRPTHACSPPLLPRTARRAIATARTVAAVPLQHTRKKALRASGVHRKRSAGAVSRAARGPRPPRRPRVAAAPPRRAQTRRTRRSPRCTARRLPRRGSAPPASCQRPPARRRGSSAGFGSASTSRERRGRRQQVGDTARAAATDRAPGARRPRRPAQPAAAAGICPNARAGA